MGRTMIKHLMNTQHSVQRFAQSIQCHPARQLLCLSPGYTQTEAESAETRPGRGVDSYSCEIPPGWLASCLLILPSVWICEMCTFNSSGIYQGLPCTRDHARHSENNPECLRSSYFAEWAPLDPPYCSWSVALDKAWACHIAQVGPILPSGRPVWSPGLTSLSCAQGTGKGPGGQIVGHVQRVALPKATEDGR